MRPPAARRTSSATGPRGVSASTAQASMDAPPPRSEARASLVPAPNSSSTHAPSATWTASPGAAVPSGAALFISRTTTRTIAPFLSSVQPARSGDAPLSVDCIAATEPDVESGRESPQQPAVRGSGRLLQRGREPIRLPLPTIPWERALFLGVAAVIGIYAGMAAGLFAQSIRFVQIVLFRGGEVAAALFGSARNAWAAGCREHLHRAHWHAEFASLAVLALPLAFAAEALAAGLVIGSGGSAGREGPVVHLGGAVAASLGRFLALPRREAAVLVACGAGAGIAASFQAPLAGGMFAVEIVLGDFGVGRFAPIVLSCVTATATSRALLGGGTELRPVSWTLQHSGEIAIYLALGIAAGGAGILYIPSIYAAAQ